jgi:hypothetical protein
LLLLLVLLGFGRSAAKDMLDLRSDEPSQLVLLALEPSVAALLSGGK